MTLKTKFYTSIYLVKYRNKDIQTKYIYLLAQKITKNCNIIKLQTIYCNKIYRKVNNRFIKGKNEQQYFERRHKH